MELTDVFEQIGGPEQQISAIFEQSLPLRYVERHLEALRRDAELAFQATRRSEDAEGEALKRETALLRS